YMAWPDFAAGGALACDLSPGAWQLREGVGVEDLPAGETLRVVVGALADGTSWSAVRRPGAEGPAPGAALVPDVTSALIQTLQPQSCPRASQALTPAGGAPVPAGARSELIRRRPAPRHRRRPRRGSGRHHRRGDRRPLRSPGRGPGCPKPSGGG